MRVYKTKTSKLLSLTKKLIPALALSLTMVTLSGEGAKAASLDITGSISGSPAETQSLVGNVNLGGSLTTDQFLALFAPYQEAYVSGYPVANAAVQSNNTANPLVISALRADTSSICSGANFSGLATITINTLGDDVSDMDMLGSWATVNGSSSLVPVAANAPLLGDLTNPANGVPNTFGRGASTVFTLTNTTPQTGVIQYMVNVGSFSELTNLAVALSADATDGSSTRITSANITVDDSNIICPPMVSPSTASTNPSAPLGTVLLSGSSLSASDPDNDTLTFSITAGNDESYFAIDPATGDISTATTNIPVGTYNLTIQVDDGNGGVATETVIITVSEDATASSANTTTNSSSNNPEASNMDTLAKTGVDSRLILKLAAIFILVSLIALDVKLNYFKD